MAVSAMIVNCVHQPNKTFESVNDFTTPIYIIFLPSWCFFRFSNIKSSYLIVILSVIYIFARAIGKYVGVFAGAQVTNQPKTVRNYLGIALLPQGGISLGLLVLVSAQLPDLYPLISTIIMIGILFFETTGPIFAKFAIDRAGEINGLDALERASSLEGIETEVA